jgi:hypothetical protein
VLHNKNIQISNQCAREIKGLTILYHVTNTVRIKKVYEKWIDKSS